MTLSLLQLLAWLLGAAFSVAWEIARSTLLHPSSWLLGAPLIGNVFSCLETYTSNTSPPSLHRNERSTLTREWQVELTRVEKRPGNHDGGQDEGQPRPPRFLRSFVYFHRTVIPCTLMLKYCRSVGGGRTTGAEITTGPTRTLPVPDPVPVSSVHRHHSSVRSPSSTLSLNPTPPPFRGDRARSSNAVAHCHLFVNQYESSHVCYNLKYFINVD